MALVVVFLLASAVRGWAAWSHRGDRLGGDEIEYDALARGLLETGEYTRQPGFSTLLYSPEDGQPTAFRPPAWPFVLAQTYRALGASPLRARAVLALWNAIGCVVLVLLVRQLGMDRRVAVAAGLLWALWPASVWYNGTRSITLATESLAVPLMILALFALARARDGRHVVGWALGGGLLLGACALARGNLVLLAPLGAAWLAVATPRGTWAGSGRAALVLLGAAAALVPWMWRNHERLGMFTLASQREPLFLGNNAWARGSYDGEFISDPRGRQFEWLNARHPGFAGRSEIEKSRIYAQEAVAFMREHPRREAWLVARRGLLFFSPLRETDDGDLALDWTFGAVVLLCAPAIGWIVAARDRGALLLVVPVLAVLATCLAVLFLPRYRYPAEPMMVALACQGAQVASRRLGVAAMVATVGLVLAINLVAALFLM